MACHRCWFDLTEPYRTEAERDAAAIRHAQNLGHSVVLSVAYGDEPFHPQAQMILSCSPRGASDQQPWLWICARLGCADGQSRRAGPADTGEAALAAYRAHEHLGGDDDE